MINSPLSTSIIGHHDHRRSRPGTLRVDDLQGDQVLGVGLQLGDDVSETTLVRIWKHHFIMYIHPPHSREKNPLMKISPVAGKQFGNKWRTWCLFLSVALCSQLCLMLGDNRFGVVGPGQLGVSQLDCVDLAGHGGDGGPLPPGYLVAQELSVDCPQVRGGPAHHDRVGAETNQSAGRRKFSVLTSTGSTFSKLLIITVTWRILHPATNNIFRHEKYTFRQRTRLLQTHHMNTNRPKESGAGTGLVNPTPITPLQSCYR